MFLGCLRATESILMFRNENDSEMRTNLAMMTMLPDEDLVISVSVCRSFSGQDEATRCENHGFSLLNLQISQSESTAG